MLILFVLWFWSENSFPNIFQKLMTQTPCFNKTLKTNVHVISCSLWRSLFQIIQTTHLFQHILWYTIKKKTMLSHESHDKVSCVTFSSEVWLFCLQHRRTQPYTRHPTTWMPCSARHLQPHTLFSKTRHLCCNKNTQQKHGPGAPPNICCKLSWSWRPRGFLRVNSITQSLCIFGVRSQLPTTVAKSWNAYGCPTKPQFWPCELCVNSKSVELPWDCSFFSYVQKVVLFGFGPKPWHANSNFPTSHFHFFATCHVTVSVTNH